MFQIPTLYTSYQELLLDLDILGKILSESAINKDELKDLLFEEYKITHPLPTLEDKRYELSDLVSSDYHISYANEVELAENEQLVDLGLSDSSDDFEFEGNIVVPESIKEQYSYGSVTDKIREAMLEEYYNNDTEEFSQEIDKVEGVFNTVENHATMYEDSSDTDESYDSEEDDEDSYGDDYSSDEDDDSYGDDYSSDEDSDSYEDDEDSYGDDYNSEDDEEDSYDDDESYDDDYTSDEDDEDEEDSYGDDYSSDEDGDEDSYEDDDYVSDDEEDSSEVEFEGNIERPIEPVPTPIDMVSRNKKDTPQVAEKSETVVNREEEPRDLREFVRKHPRCEVSFALKYFSRKEIEKYLMMGKILKKGTKLHI